MTSQPAAISVEDAAALLREGGVIAYPTEAVWGLGCDPGNETAVQRLLSLKQRDVRKGLILAAGNIQQLAPYAAWGQLPDASRTTVLSSWPGPHTWIVPTAPTTPPWIRGEHHGVAVRVSAHPQVVALCAAFGGAIVSTSANPAGHPPPYTRTTLDPAILAGIDGLVAGETSGQERPTSIRDARSGGTLRA